MKETERRIAKLAWLAGIIDGEGYITTNKSRTHLRIVPVVGMANTNKAIVYTFIVYCNYFGLAPCKYFEKGTNKTKGVYRIQIGGQQTIIKFLELILPYLVAKRDQARLLVEFCKSRHEKLNKVKRHRGAFYSRREKEINKILKQLNRKGK